MNLPTLSCVWMLAGWLAACPSAAAPNTTGATSHSATELAATAAGAEYKVTLTAPGNFVVGQAGLLQVQLEPLAPYKCNDQYPYRFKLVANPAAEFPQPVVSQAEVSARLVTLALPFTPKAPGNLRIAGEFSFSVCTEEKCLVQKVALDVVVVVAARPS
jgi:hypothetical protein